VMNATLPCQSMIFPLAKRCMFFVTFVSDTYN
jgi:hypothetical protein